MKKSLEYFYQIDNLRVELINDIKQQLANRNIESLPIIKWTVDCEYYNEKEDTKQYEHIIPRLYLQICDDDAYETIPCYMTDVFIYNGGLYFNAHEIYDSNNTYSTISISEVDTDTIIHLLSILETLFREHDANQFKLY